MSYDLKDVKVPLLAGAGLRVFTRLLESKLFRGLLIPKLFSDAGITPFRSLVIDEAPTLQPFVEPEAADRERSAIQVRDLDPLAGRDPAGDFQFRTVADFSEAYQSGRTNPEEIARRALEAIRDSNAGDKPLRAIIACQEDDVLRQAAQSAQRWKNGAPLSVFDGVPVAVKDELDQTPYPTTAGTKFLGDSPAREDATPVARLRAAGALLIGKANMHEIGIGVTGLNPHHGVCRNPYNVDHHTGGSSSGSGSAVAAGLCPVAIGADGGGSVRIPAGLCGVAGLKATFGRVSEHGAYPLCWSVAHVGPLAATVRDVALAYGLIAGPDEKDAWSRRQPPVHLSDLDKTDLSGLRLGVYSEWFDHGQPDLVAACRAALERLVLRGASVVEIEVPELDNMRVAHAMTISSEMYASMEPYYKKSKTDFGLDVRVNLALAANFNNADYIRAQRFRTRMFRNFAGAFEKCDLILTPTTGVTAPPIRPAALPAGESDLTTLMKIMRFILAGNFCGFPALSVPIGYGDNGLPVGLQLMAPHWQEHLLLRVGNAAEADLKRKRPQFYRDLLG